jgi:uncharacterized protein YbaA (DUF1428 family)
MTYVDGFGAAVPTTNRDAYKKHAEAAAIVFKDHGALQVVECWGDDVPEGKVTSFPMAVKQKEDETVVFSWTTWPSRQARNEGMKKVMADPPLQPDKIRCRSTASASFAAASRCSSKHDRLFLKGRDLP